MLSKVIMFQEELTVLEACYILLGEIKNWTWGIVYSKHELPPSSSALPSFPMLLFMHNTVKHFLKSLKNIIFAAHCYCRKSWLIADNFAKKSNLSSDLFNHNIDEYL